MLRLLRVFIISLAVSLLGCLAVSSKQITDANTPFRSVENPHPYWVGLDATLTEVVRDGQVSIFEVSHRKGKEGAGAIGRFIFCYGTYLADQRGYKYLGNSELIDNKVAIFFSDHGKDDVEMITKKKYSGFPVVEVMDIETAMEFCGFVE